jgi:hypothetical protein
MRIGMFLSTVFLIASCFTSARGQPNEYGYIFYESTGQNQFILIGRREVPVTFDRIGSDRIALHALRSLKASILYGNSNGRSIILVGEFQARTHVFTLTHWYIRTPFVEWVVKDETHVPHQFNKKLRQTLRREDFQKDEGFDPYDAGFDPRSFSRRSKARGRA